MQLRTLPCNFQNKQNKLSKFQAKCDTVHEASIDLWKYLKAVSIICPLTTYYTNVAFAAFGAKTHKQTHVTL